MKWTVEYTKEAENDLRSLDGAQRLQVLKAIKKVSVNPLPNSEGGYGKPLGNHLSSKLTGYMKIKLLKFGLRVVYAIENQGNIMRIIIISVRDDETIYKMAQERIK
ncbi:type II toxin-antitoxin system RelE family toxin [Lutispora sp.]|uniref:type II toxin-antitoxin system RelE family toxin n=1 Tax=Lutispora sp. TaxID=2828727 RepID=UPI000EDA7032|nr:type II toxin-antitoxin system RelE/ParE family toxin [Lutispora sp.]MEA4961918.1 type II toxin-antitoxin system RelE/ParE family toxin [Lutispora sp.]HCJ58022.1 addiction module toxin RelE [Clostridiaceae bacterium]